MTSSQGSVASSFIFSFLSQLYLQHRTQIRSILSQLPPTLPAYHNLEWRLDVQVCVKLCFVFFLDKSRL